MENNQPASTETQPAAAPADNWAAVESAYKGEEFASVQDEAPAAETVETPAAEEKKETPAAEEAAAEPEEITITLDDLDKSSIPADEGTWLKVFQDRGLDIPEGFNEDEGFDLLIAAEEKKWQSKVEEAKSITLDKVYSELRPETAMKLKLMEMGYKEDQIFGATREIQEYLKMDDSAIVRANLETFGYPPEVLDHKMEALVADPTKLKLEAEAIRHDLKAAEQNIVKQQETLVQKYEQERQQRVANQKQQEQAKFKEALNTVSKFLDVPVAAEVKDAIYRKYANGAYDNDLNSPQSRVEYIMYKELGHKITKLIQSKAFNEGRETIKKKLSEVPPVTSNSGQRVQPNQKDADNWTAIERAFGGQ
jgi:Skp family chaperone for outer membrane proteins